MDLKAAGQVIRDTVDMDTILALYGYKTNRSGFMCCPFHGEREGSLKVYENKRGWHCYGCGRGDSVIDFVMEHENCNYRTAVIAIDKALHLQLTDIREDPFDDRRQQRLQVALDEFVKAVYDCLDVQIRSVEHEQKIAWNRMKKCMDDPQNATTEDWNFYFNWEEEDDYSEYRIEKIKELKKEVAEWRRKYRRGI